MDYDQFNKDQAAYKAANLEASMKTYQEAVDLAVKNGWTLFQANTYHFQLCHLVKGWLYNLYPSKQRIYADPNHRGGFLNVTKPWTLLDVVNEAIKIKG
jgi:hypothetical protein